MLTANFDNIFEGIIISNFKNRIIYINSAFEKITGYKRSEVIGKNLSDIIPNSSYEKLMNRLKKLIEHHSVDICELEIVNKSGSIIIIELSNIVMLHNGDKAILSNIRDITKRKNIEQKLIKTNERMIQEKLFSENLIKSLPGIFYLAEVKHSEAYLIKWNENFQNKTQFSSDELKNKKMIDFFYEDEKIKYNNLFNKLKKGEDSNMILNPIFKDGKVRRYIIQAVGFEENEKKYYLGTGVDITKIRDLERKLIVSIIQTEEFERKRIASDLHDGLGPELSAIKLYVQGLIDSTNSVEKIKISKTLINLIDHSIDNISEISFNISPHILVDYGLEEAINIYIDKLQINPNLEIITNFDKIERFNINNELTLYRIIGELFHNTLKYAYATKINLEIRIKKKKIYIYYADNGKGFDLTHQLEMKTGMGIQNMIARINSLEGTIEIQSKIDGGMSAIIKLPYFLQNE